MSSTGFGPLGITPQTVERLAELGIQEPSPIQAEAIPPALQGKDVVAQSQTGTGKTLAYVLPVLHKLDLALRETQAMILVPTRELGMQIIQTLEELAEGTDVRVQQLIGGASIERQIDKLRLKPHIVVGTPGRVQELVKLRKLKLHSIRTVVVDEVDQVFELGSLHEVEALLKGMQRGRQMLFYSATFPPQTQAVIDRWMQEPAFVRVKPAQRTSETLEHLYLVAEERDKTDVLRRLVRLWNPKAAIVFINETDDIGEAVAKLKYVGLSAEGLYGDSFKQERAKAMQAFRAGRFQLLVATDVAARGLDLPHVTHVFNLDPPIDADHYVHRVGRTGRMGKRGVAVTIITRRQQFIIEKFSKSLGIEIKRKFMSHGKIFDARPPREEGDMHRKPEGRSSDNRVQAPVNHKAGDSLPRPAKRTEEGLRSAARTDGGAAAAARSAKPAAGQAVRSAGAQTDKRKNQALRERDRKNKGAPRWLKAKQERSDSSK